MTDPKVETALKAIDQYIATCQRGTLLYFNEESRVRRSRWQRAYDLLQKAVRVLLYDE